MAETVTPSEVEESRTVRARLPGKRVRLTGGLAVLFSGLVLVYVFGAGEPTDRTSTEPAEASLTVPVSLRSTAPESDRPPVAGRSEKPAESKTSSGKSAAATPALSGVARDEAYRRLVIGKWETERSGHRELTVRPDGTATMIVQLTGFNAVLFGKKLTFWIQWTIQDGKLAFSTTGGEPASRIKVITVMYGTNRTQQIRSLTKDRLLLIDEEGDPDHDCRRVVASTN